MNLKSIAAELKISPSTVSRVVNGNKNFSVSPELREKILARADASGYSPNPMYQSMRKKDNKQISILLPNLLHVTGETDISTGVDSFCEYLLRHGYSFHYLGHTLEYQKTYGLPQWKVAGALPVDVRKKELIEELNSSNIPYVSLNGVAGSNGTSVVADDYANMMLGMEHLYALGHRRIVYLARLYRDPEKMPLLLADHHYSVLRRIEAYQDFCVAHEIPVQKEDLCREIDTEAAIHSGIERKVTAFVTYTFSLGLKAEFYLKKRGFRIPEDVSVLTFNNPESAQFTDPPLTCIEIPVRKMGIAAAELLIKKKENRTFAAGETLMFKGHLIKRESTGPCSIK